VRGSEAKVEGAVDASRACFSRRRRSSTVVKPDSLDPGGTIWTASWEEDMD